MPNKLTQILVLQTRLRIKFDSVFKKQYVFWYSLRVIASA